MYKKCHQTSPGVILLLVLISAACSTASEIPLQLDLTEIPSAIHTPTFTLEGERPAPTVTQPAQATPLLLSTSVPSRPCSPLLGYSSAELILAISNPFQPPPTGSDLPHQAVDIAVTRSGLALTGNPIRTVLAGYVAAVINDRFPYGNAIMVETPLESLPEGLYSALQLPTPAPTLPPHPALTCPVVARTASWQEESRSLYLLYAHMQSPANYHLDDRVGCGTEIGQIGQSGNALNPHIHLEIRIGPSNVRFNGLAHYETRAKPEEMSNYCLWRVSNVFQLVDPTLLLMSLP